MAKTRAAKTASGGSPLMVRLDGTSKAALKEAARLRGISVSDYVRTVTVAQARHEVDAARQQIISLTAAEQLAFWQALQKPSSLTPAQKRLGRIMRGRE
ncbi:MAG TPA: DUF1778 domain-containing protein [Planctomycetaceae bacterium]